MEKEKQMKNRFPQGVIARFTLCLCVLLAPLALLHAQDTLTTGTPFNIVNENSGLCIGASGQGTANGTAVQMYTCANGTYSTQLSQEWIFTAASSGYYEVSDANATGETWNVTGNGATNGSLIQLWTYAANSNEEFSAVSLGSGYYKFVGQGSGLCLDVPGNSTALSVQLEIYTCNGTTAQAFKLVTP
jgi:Ricin-type beta-trefoil lectin domain-like